jgi:hypothetical protein
MSNRLEIQKSSIIHARPAVIFKILTDVENWNTWTASVKKSTLLNNTKFSVGANVKIVQPKLLPVTWEITDIRDNNSFTWISKSAGLRITAKHSIEKVGYSSKVLLVTTYEGLLSKIIYSLTSELTNKYMAMEVDGLKLLSEKQADRLLATNGDPEGNKKELWLER